MDDQKLNDVKIKYKELLRKYNENDCDEKYTGRCLVIFNSQEDAANVIEYFPHENILTRIKMFFGCSKVEPIQNNGCFRKK